MKYLKNFRLFESLESINSLVNNYLEESTWDLENSIGNCSFFSKDFYEWAKSKGLDPKIGYMKQSEDFEITNEIEDHVVPILFDHIIDFTWTPLGVSRFLRKGKDVMINQLSPEVTHVNNFQEKYSQFGYNELEEISYEDAFIGEEAACLTIDYPEKKNENFGSAFSTILNMRLQDSGNKSVDSHRSDYKPVNFQEEIKSLKKLSGKYYKSDTQNNIFYIMICGEFSSHAHSNYSFNGEMVDKEIEKKIDKIKKSGVINVSKGFIKSDTYKIKSIKELPEGYPKFGLRNSYFGPDKTGYSSEEVKFQTYIIEVE